MKWNSIYSEVPMLLTKLKVQDRTLFKTTNAEQTCVEPEGLQVCYLFVYNRYCNNLFGNV